MTVAGQTAVSYSYDNADRLTGVTRGAASVTVAYDNADKRTSLTLPNGIVVEYAVRRRLAADGADLQARDVDAGDADLRRMTSTVSGRRVGGTYARTGLPAALASATYDDANQVATFGGTSFTYDDNGNLTSDGVRSYTWNARNQLASLTGPVNGVFAYDGFGRRRSKTIGGTTTQFLYDGLNPVQELASGTPTANLLTGLGIDEFFTRTDSAGVRNFLTDALGSSVALADGSGAVQTEYTYEPFGSATSEWDHRAPIRSPSPAAKSDGTGLHYYRARYYHPTAQRFIAEDPLGFAAGDANLYSYTFNDPTNSTDPTGEIAPWVAAAAIVQPRVQPPTIWPDASSVGREQALGCGLGLLGLGAGKAAGPGPERSRAGGVWSRSWRARVWEQRWTGRWKEIFLRPSRTKHGEIAMNVCSVKTRQRVVEVKSNPIWTTQIPKIPQQKQHTGECSEYLPSVQPRKSCTTNQEYFNQRQRR